MLNINEAAQLRILEFVRKRGSVRSEDIIIDYTGPDPRAVFLITSKNKKILKTDGYLGNVTDDLWTVTESGESYVELLYEKLGDKKRKEKYARKSIVTSEDCDSGDFIAEDEEVTMTDEKKCCASLLSGIAEGDSTISTKKKSSIMPIVLLALGIIGLLLGLLLFLSRRNSEPIVTEAPFIEVPMIETSFEEDDDYFELLWSEDDWLDTIWEEEDLWWEEDYEPQRISEEIDEIHMFFFGQRIPAIQGIDFRVNFNPFFQQLEVDIHNWGTYFTGFETHILLSDPFGNINYSFLVRPSLLPTLNESRFFIAELERPLTAVAYASVITDFQPEILEQFRTLTNVTVHRHFDTDHLQFLPTSRNIRISDELERLIDRYGIRSSQVQDYLLQARVRRQQIGGRIGEWLPYQVDITPATLQFIAGLQTPGDILLHLNNVVFNQNDINYIRSVLATMYSPYLRHRIEEVLVVLEDVANVEVAVHANPLFNPSVTYQNLTLYHHNRVERLRNVQSIGLIQRITHTYLAWISEAIILSFIDEDICYEDFLWWNRRFNEEFVQPILQDQAIFLVHGVPFFTYDVDILLQIHSFFYARPEPRFRAIHESLGIIVRIFMGLQPLPGVTGFISVNFSLAGTGDTFIEIFPSVYLHRIRMGSSQPEQLYFDLHSFSTSQRNFELQIFFFDEDFTPMSFVTTQVSSGEDNPNRVMSGVNLHNVSHIRIRRVF